jgi:hypothetical protein
MFIKGLNHNKQVETIQMPSTDEWWIKRCYWFFDDAGVWTQDFVLARQVLYHFSLASGPIKRVKYTELNTLDNKRAWYMLWHVHAKQKKLVTKKLITLYDPIYQISTICESVLVIRL